MTGRECGSCTMCCKLFTIPAVPKSAGVWCQHCIPGTGCRIYEQRPDQCRDFLCEWLTDKRMPDHWYPGRCKMVVSIQPATGFLYVQVDSSQPSIWRREPYRSDLAAWAQQMLGHRLHVIVFVGENATLIMPDQEVPLGPMRPDEGFSIKRVFSGGGARYEVVRESTAG